MAQFCLWEVLLILLKQKFDRRRCALQTPPRIAATFASSLVDEYFSIRMEFYSPNNHRVFYLMYSTGIMASFLGGHFNKETVATLCGWGRMVE